MLMICFIGLFIAMFIRLGYMQLYEGKDLQ